MNFTDRLQLCLDGFNRFHKNAVFSETKIEEDGKVKTYYTIYTEFNSYNIVLKENYLGSFAKSRRSLPGEDWLRGRDLADGPDNEDTLFRILTDIIAFELVDK